MLNLEASRPHRVLHRLPLLLAILLLVVNDHLLKAAWPGLVTGKLSDLAGLFALPLVLWAALDLRRRAPLGGRELLMIAVGAGALFSAFKLVSPLREAVTQAYALIGLPARVAPDPTDLLCVPAVIAAWAYGLWHLAHAAPQTVWPRLRAASRWMVLASFALVCAATSPAVPLAPVRAQVLKRSGELFVTHDLRVYEDMPFEITLSGGPFLRVTTFRRAYSYLVDEERERHDGEVAVWAKVELTPDDPRWKRPPVRFATDAPVWWRQQQGAELRWLRADAAPGDQQLLVRVEREDGRAETALIGFETEVTEP